MWSLWEMPIIMWHKIKYTKVCIWICALGKNERKYYESKRHKDFIKRTNEASFHFVQIILPTIHSQQSNIFKCIKKLIINETHLLNIQSNLRNDMIGKWKFLAQKLKQHACQAMWLFLLKLSYYQTKYIIWFTRFTV